MFTGDLIMGTKSAITVKYNGITKYYHRQFDGNIEYTGIILLQFCDTLQLLDFKDLSWQLIERFMKGFNATETGYDNMLDSLFYTYGYLIDFDNKIFTIFKGGQESPYPHNPLGVNATFRDPDYYPCLPLFSVPFNTPFHILKDLFIYASRKFNEHS